MCTEKHSYETIASCLIINAEESLKTLTEQVNHLAIASDSIRDAMMSTEIEEVITPETLEKIQDLADELA